MTARAVAGVLFAAACGLASLPVRGADPAPAPVPVVDLHVNLPYRVGYGRGEPGTGSGQFVASRLLKAGVAGVVLPLFVPHRVSPSGPRPEDLEESFVRVAAFLPKTPPYAPPGCARAPGKVRTWLAFEGSAPLAGDPGAVPGWVARGVRLFGLVHTKDNALATSSASPTGDVGLTPEGRELVRRIHREGGVVDVSHASDAATDEVLRMAALDRAPVVATHSNARALADHPRNLTDEQARAIASTGGVIGVNFHSTFLVRSGRARLRDVVRHVQHLVRVAGAHHVAIGSDFEGDIVAPIGLREVSAMPALSAALEAAGTSREDVEKVFHRNALRVLCPRDAPSAEK